MTTPRQLALLILLNIHDYQTDQRMKKPERTINTTRVIMTHKSLIKLGRRKHLTPDFLRMVYIEMQELGWFMIPDGTDKEILIRMSSTDNWSRIGTQPRCVESLFEEMMNTLFDYSNKDRTEVQILNLVSDLIDNG